MNKMGARKTIKYQPGMSRVYLSLTVTILSVILASIAFTLHQDALLLLFYVASTAIITATLFVFKKRFLLKLLAEDKSTFKEGEDTPSKWKSMILLFFFIFGMIAFPFILTRLMEPRSWFMLMVAITTGISMSELCFYIYNRRDQR